MVNHSATNSNDYLHLKCSNTQLLPTNLGGWMKGSPGFGHGDMSHVEEKQVSSTFFKELSNMFIFLKINLTGGIGLGLLMVDSL